MPGIGTIINVAAVFAAGFVGMLIGRFVTEKLQESMLICCGISTLFIGISGAIKEMLVVEEHMVSVQGSLMMILTLVIGTLAGELLDLDGKIERFGSWLKIKTGNAKDGGFVSAFVTASLTVCIGAMAVVGSIQDSILHDPSILIAKSIMDFVIIVVMTAAMGKGAMFSAIPIGILQGSVTVLAGFLSPVLTDEAMSNLSLTGSVIIACVGINLVFDRKIRVANMLPSLIAAAVWALI